MSNLKPHSQKQLRSLSTQSKAYRWHSTSIDGPGRKTRGPGRDRNLNTEEKTRHQARAPILGGMRYRKTVRRPQKSQATYDDVLAAPENMVAEIMHGDLFLQPRPAYPHGEAASVLGMLLGPPFRLGRGGPGGWVIMDEPEVHLDGHVLVPDLAGWRRSADNPLDLNVAFQTRAPDWVCEVLSPSTQGSDRVRKLPIYGEAGVTHVWLVDPLVRTLEIYEYQGSRYSLAGTHEGEDLVRGVPFDEIEISLSDLWVS